MGGGASAAASAAPVAVGGAGAGPMPSPPGGGVPLWEPLTLGALRDRLRKLAAQRAEAQFHTPRNLVMALVGEVGQVSELFRWQTDSSAQPGLASWCVCPISHPERWPGPASACLLPA